MANPSKKKGTAAETRVVKFLRSFDIQAERRALSGSEDQGDIKVIARDVELVFEVKSGKQTMNPTRNQMDEWIRQTIIEGINAGCDSMLVVARHGKSPKDYDVWIPCKNNMIHWYLDDWCNRFGGEVDG